MDSDSVAGWLTKHFFWNSHRDIACYHLQDIYQSFIKFNVLVVHLMVFCCCRCMSLLMPDPRSSSLLHEFGLLRLTHLFVNLQPTRIRITKQRVNVITRVIQLPLFVYPCLLHLNSVTLNTTHLVEHHFLLEVKFSIYLSILACN